MSKRRRYFCYCFIIASLSTGCGGGSSAGTSNSNVTAIGRASVAYSGHVRSTVADSSGAVTIAGMSGAAFTSINFNPVKSLDNTKLAYSRNLGGYVYPYPNGPETAFGKDVVTFVPSWGPNGKICYSTTLDGTNFQLGVLNADGTESVFSTKGIGGGVFSPDGAHIAFITQSANLGVMSSSGSNVVTLDSSGQINTIYGVPSWLNNSTVLYSRTNGGSQFLLYQVSISGGTPAPYSTALQPGNNIYNASVAPDGTKMAVSISDTAHTAPTDIYVSTMDGNTHTSLTPTGYQSQFGTFSPDGRCIAFHRSLNPGPNDGTDGIYISDIHGGNQTPLVLDPIGSGQLDAPTNIPSWSPFPSTQLFVGSGGSLASSASGFLFTQNGDVFQSFLSFTATTPSTAKILSSSGNSGGGAMVYTITADNLSRIVWTNAYFGASSSISGMTNTGSAVISYNGATGGVDFVAPVGGPSPSYVVSRTAGPMVYQGGFRGIYDRTGKNLAPAGASEISVDPRTGQLLSFK